MLYKTSEFSPDHVLGNFFQKKGILMDLPVLEPVDSDSNMPFNVCIVFRVLRVYRNTIYSFNYTNFQNMV